ncbi:hypothetical protein AAFF_G00096600 [Aldrovandia affinis]|uniref:Uncharacterized protein n=1 Tax=Aldrovandia affinis TaxID=143900 RepID=A0AAD7RVA7_9TELE|nr:hypothetical protein AAFF_G00096600 [Aldrovandia affinis]
MYPRDKARFSSGGVPGCGSVQLLGSLFFPVMHAAREITPSHHHSEPYQHRWDRINTKALAAIPRSCVTFSRCAGALEPNAGWGISLGERDPLRKPEEMRWLDAVFPRGDPPT